MDTSYYQKRLKKVIKLMEKNSCLILMSPPIRLRSQDVYYPYRTSSHLIYLTGILQENIIFVLLSTGEKHIFAEKHSPKKEIWEGKRLSSQEIFEQLRFSAQEGDAHHDHNAFWHKLPFLIQNKNTIYWDYTNEPNDNQKILSLLNDIRKNLRGGCFAPTNLKNACCLLDELRLFKDSLEIKLMKKGCSYFCLRS